MTAFVRPDMTVAEEADWLALEGRVPVPKRKRGSPERDFQVAQVRWLRSVLPHGSKVFAVKNEHAANAKSGHARARFYAKRRAEGVLDGMVDVGVALPEGRTLWIENKSKTGVLSEDQQDVHADLHALGHVVIVATDIESTRHGLLAAGVPLREAPGQLARPAVVRAAKRKAVLPADAVPEMGAGPEPMVRMRHGKRTVMVPARSVRG